LRLDARQLSVLVAAARGRLKVDVTGRVCVRGQRHAVTELVAALIRQGVLWQEFPACGFAEGGAFVRPTTFGDWCLQNARRLEAS
jgi:hypothetical protein